MGRIKRSEMNALVVTWRIHKLRANFLFSVRSIIEKKMKPVPARLGI